MRRFFYRFKHWFQVTFLGYIEEFVCPEEAVVSPGVYVVECSEKGEVQEPVLVKSAAEFKKLFGGNASGLALKGSMPQDLAGVPRFSAVSFVSEEQLLDPHCRLKDPEDDG